VEDQLLPKNSPDLTLLARVHLLPFRPLNRRRQNPFLFFNHCPGNQCEDDPLRPYKTAEWVIVVGDAWYHFNQFENVGFGFKRPVRRVANSSLFYEVKGRVLRSETNRRSFDDGDFLLPYRKRAVVLAKPDQSSILRRWARLFLTKSKGGDSLLP